MFPTFRTISILLSFFIFYACFFGTTSSPLPRDQVPPMEEGVTDWKAEINKLRQEFKAMQDNLTRTENKLKETELKLHYAETLVGEKCTDYPLVEPFASRFLNETVEICSHFDSRDRSFRPIEGGIYFVHFGYPDIAGGEFYNPHPALIKSVHMSVQKNNKFHLAVVLPISSEDDCLLPTTKLKTLNLSKKKCFLFNQQETIDCRAFYYKTFIESKGIIAKVGDWTTFVNKPDSEITTFVVPWKI